MAWLFQLTWLHVLLAVAQDGNDVLENAAVELLALQVVEAARGRELKNLLLLRCKWGYGCRLRSLLRVHLLILTGSSGGRGRQDSGGLCAAGQHRSDRAAGESAPQTQGDTSS